MTKEPLILLPGMMCDERLFGPQIETLGRDRQIISMALTQGETIDAIADAILANAPDSFALGGLSMGGIVAMQIIAQAPERVTRLALMDTNPLREPVHVGMRRAPQIAAARHGKLAQIMRDEMKPRYLAPGSGRGAVLDLVMKMALDLGPQVFVHQSNALRTRPDQVETLRRVNVPTLILFGRHDRLCPFNRHRLMSRLIAHSKLVILKDAGHLPPLEVPEKVTASLEAWLAAQMPVSV